MSKRNELNLQETEAIVGGVLKWKNDGTVYPKDNPDAVFYYNDYTECAQWLVANWNGKQNEDCLIAMEEAGLVRRA